MTAETEAKMELTALVASSAGGRLKVTRIGDDDWRLTILGKQPRGKIVPRDLRDLADGMDEVDALARTAGL